METTLPSGEATRQMQLCILGILKAIDRVCHEHQLTYYMIAGTMLGAVRHKGFIPWDDDADVGLPRPDYDQLIAHANEWLPDEYELVSSDTDAHYPYQFARIQDRRTTYILRRSFNYVGGVPVDIFPLDGMTANTMERQWHYKRYALHIRMLYFNLVDPMKHGHGLHYFFVRTIHRLLSSKWLHRRLDQIQKEFDYDSSMLVADHDNKPERGILPKEVYGTPIPYPFEDTTLMGVAQADSYLKCCYGDYMRMPDVLPPANFRFLRLDLPYQAYLEQQGQ